MNNKFLTEIGMRINMNSVIQKIKSSLWFAIIIATLFSCSVNKKVEVVDLKCEYLENPLGIDIVKPRLSWQLITERNNVSQKAYQIMVSTDAAKLENNVGDLWDTDKVLSDQSIQIIYDGNELESRQKVFWKVKVWNQNNVASSWSEVSTWEMAFLNQSVPLCFQAV